MGLVPFRLEGFFRGVRVADGLKMKRTLVADRLEDVGSFVGRDFLIGMEIDYKTRDVVDDTSDTGDIAFGILQSNANLRPRDLQPP